MNLPHFSLSALINRPQTEACFTVLNHMCWILSICDTASHSSLQLSVNHQLSLPMSRMSELLVRQDLVPTRTTGQFLSSWRLIFHHSNITASKKQSLWACHCHSHALSMSLTICLRASSAFQLWALVPWIEDCYLPVVAPACCVYLQSVPPLWILLWYLQLDAYRLYFYDHNPFYFNQISRV